MNYGTIEVRLLTALIEARTFRHEPFTLIDVGCSMGIHGLWRLFGDQLRAYAFDPQQEEIARLQAQESNPNVHYHAAFVGLPADHPFLKRKATQRGDDDYQCEIMARSSTWAYDCANRVAGGSASKPLPPPPKVGVSEFVRREKLTDVDFIKIDTDGSDLECIISSEDCLRPCNVLGFMIETMFQGSSDDTSNTFHNIDRFMKQHGYMIYNTCLYRYSRAALPAASIYPNYVAQTVSGQPLWGDTLFLVDGTTRDRFAALAAGLSPIKVLKLACLYELYQVPDCAVDLLQHHAARLAPLTNVTRLIELVTPSLGSRRVSYREYVASFRKPAA